MNSFLRIALVVSAVAIGVWAYSSGVASRSTSVAAAEPAKTAPAAAPTNAAKAPAHTNTAAAAKNTAAAPKLQNADGLTARAASRWTTVARADWIDAYTYLTAEQQRAVPIGQYLNGKNFHRYENPVIERVIAIEGVNGYVAVRVLWTPDHPELQRAIRDPNKSLTEELHIVESWRWQGDDWYFVEANSNDEFFTAHPKLK